METEIIHITAEKGIYKGEIAVLLHFVFNQLVVNQLRKIEGVRWSKTLNCWRAPYTKAFIEQLKLVEGITLEFKKSEETKPSTTIALAKPPINNQPIIANSIAKIEPLPNKSSGTTVSINNENISSDEISGPSIAILSDIEKWIDYLKCKQYADNSIKTYHSAMLVFASWLGDKNHKEVRRVDVTEFMKYMVIKRKISRSYQNQIVNALKSFYKHTFSIHLSADMLERPRKQFSLPKYLTREEVSKLFQALKYLKHRCIVSLMYACGLRNGEIIRIELRDIDAGQRLLHVRQSKGNKDRVVPIPLSIMVMLNDYCEAYKPVKYLFEGQVKGEQYTSRSVQQFFKDAVIRSGIRQTEASPHWLRHSYATHIMEMGTNLRDLQALLGHKSLRTTEIYTHISSTNFSRIVSPFDTLPDTKNPNDLLDSGKKPYI